jgi:hypothetical protein
VRGSTSRQRSAYLEFNAAISLMVRAQASELTHLAHGEGAGERTNSSRLW